MAILAIVLRSIKCSKKKVHFLSKVRGPSTKSIERGKKGLLIRLIDGKSSNVQFSEWFE